MPKAAAGAPRPSPFCNIAANLGVSGQVRRAAELENDRQRRMVDALLFGGYADQIRFAALSLDGIGLRSYGKGGLSYGLCLGDVAIAKRASLLQSIYDPVSTFRSAISAAIRASSTSRSSGTDRACDDAVSLVSIAPTKSPALSATSTSDSEIRLRCFVIK